MNTGCKYSSQINQLNNVTEPNFFNESKTRLCKQKLISARTTWNAFLIYQSGMEASAVDELIKHFKLKIKTVMLFPIKVVDVFSYIGHVCVIILITSQYTGVSFSDVRRWFWANVEHSYFAVFPVTFKLVDSGNYVN